MAVLCGGDGPELSNSTMAGSYVCWGDCDTDWSGLDLDTTPSNRPTR